jgi:hypothetical protein
MICTGLRLEAMKSQLTGNCALYHVARELSRKGWHVAITSRNARGADLYAASADEATVHPLQSKGLSKRMPVPLGNSLEKLRSEWWIITTFAKDHSPICYVMTLDEVKDRAFRNITGTEAYWLPPKEYDIPEFREAWHRLGDPGIPRTSGET